MFSFFVIILVLLVLFGKLDYTSNEKGGRFKFALQSQHLIYFHCPLVDISWVNKAKKDD